MSFADGDEDDEQWLKAHNKAFDKKEPTLDGPTQSWRERAERNKRTHSQRKAPPIRVGNIKKTCKGCGEEAAVELFRDGKCLACQAAEFLGPME